MSRLSVLLAEDDPGYSDFARLSIEDGGYAVRTVVNGLEALLAIERETPGLVLTDLRMPEMDGLALLRHVRQRWPNLPVLVYSVEQDLSCVIEIIRLGAVNFLLKPIKPAALLKHVKQALLETTVNPETTSVPEIVGLSRPIIEVRHLVALAARTDVNVLVIGETGTGKELVARAVSRNSRRGPGPFIAHNCAATPSDLFESEFFGHIRGAFTGADRDRAGLLEQADGGVLFLDELETLTLFHQAKLLRVLDDGEVKRVGSNRSRTVSVRFVAATNRDPEEMLTEGSLRRDLYYRLRGHEIRLPTLAGRREDIPLLVRHFLSDHGPGIEADALSALASRSWPGNVRELRNMVLAARGLADGGRIAPRHLPLWGAGSPARSGAPVSAAPSCSTLQEMERAAIRNALELKKGNRTQASEVLGIDRSTLRRKIREMGIE